MTVPGCDDCCHMDNIKQYGMGEMREIARIKRDIFDLDPHHLIWGSIACAELWMWTDESGNGLGLDVTMKEAYNNAVGATGVTTGPSTERSGMSESTFRDFPMTYHALVDMPSTQMVTGGEMRSRIYNALCQQNAAHSNYFVFNNNNALQATTHRAIDQTASEFQELLPAVLTRRSIIGQSAEAIRASPVIISAVASISGGGSVDLSARIWEEETPRKRDGTLEVEYFCARIVVTNSNARPVQAKVPTAGLPKEAGLVAMRLFGAVYPVTLSPTKESSEGMLLVDFVDGWSTNVYSIGCQVSPAPMDQLAANGNFETV